MKPPLYPDNYYHIYNHSNGSDNIFENDGNYHYFLKQYTKYISPIADTFAYCLMPNHFHFTIRIKTVEGIGTLIGTGNSDFSSRDDDYLSNFLSKQFAKLFSSYTQSFNRQQRRYGSLFIPNFKRKLIETDDYLKRLIHYIHFNPVHHGFVDEIKDWQYSSYNSFFTDKASNLARDEVIELFVDKNSFVRFHQRYIDDEMIMELD